MKHDHDTEGLPLPHRDSVEFTAALLLGAAVGVYAALALRPERSGRDRIRRKLRGPVRKVRRQRRVAAEAAGTSVEEGGRFGHALGELGREFVDAAGAEVRRSLGKDRGRAGKGRLHEALEGLSRLRDRL
jgi:gas vesicle protein